MVSLHHRDANVAFPAQHILLEKMEQGAVVLTAAGRIAYCNDCLARMLRVALDQLTGAAMDLFVPASSRSTFEVLLAKACQTSVQGEIHLQRTDGPCQVWCETRGDVKSSTIND